MQYLQLFYFTCFLSLKPLNINPNNSQYTNDVLLFHKHKEFYFCCYNYAPISNQVIVQKSVAPSKEPKAITNNSKSKDPHYIQ